MLSSIYLSENGEIQTLKSERAIPRGQIEFNQKLCYNGRMDCKYSAHRVPHATVTTVKGERSVVKVIESHVE